MIKGKDEVKQIIKTEERTDTVRQVIGIKEEGRTEPTYLQMYQCFQAPESIW